MITIYLVKENSDKTEGRGPEVTVAAFTNEDDAWAFAETRFGVMGLRPDTTWREHYARRHYADVYVEPIGVCESLHEHQEYRQRELAKAARKRLSDAEWQALRAEMSNL